MISTYIYIYIYIYIYTYIYTTINNRLSDIAIGLCMYIDMLNKEHLGCKERRGQSEATVV